MWRALVCRCQQERVEPTQLTAYPLWGQGPPENNALSPGPRGNVSTHGREIVAISYDGHGETDGLSMKTIEDAFQQRQVFRPVGNATDVCEPDRAIWATGSARERLSGDTHWNLRQLGGRHIPQRGMGNVFRNGNDSLSERQVKGGTLDLGVYDAVDHRQPHHVGREERIAGLHPGHRVIDQNIKTQFADHAGNPLQILLASFQPSGNSHHPIKQSAKVIVKLAVWIRNNGNCLVAEFTKGLTQPKRVRAPTTYVKRGTGDSDTHDTTAVA